MYPKGLCEKCVGNSQNTGSYFHNLYIWFIMKTAVSFYNVYNVYNCMYSISVVVFA